MVEAASAKDLRLGFAEITKTIREEASGMEGTAKMPRLFETICSLHIEMKLITQGSTPLRIWMALFLTDLIIVSGIFSAVWGVFYLADGRSPCDYRWIVGGAFLFAVFLAYKCTRVEIREQQELRDCDVRIPGHHPEFGEYVHAPHFDWWNTSTNLVSGYHFNIRGNGSAPTAEQFSTWKLIEANIARLVSIAQQALFSSSEVPGHNTDVNLIANGVAFLDNREFEISFEDNDITAEIHMRPNARYSADLVLLSATWEP